MKATWIYRHLRSLFGESIVAPGLNLTPQTDLSKVLALIRKLRPQDCGRNLIRLGGPADGGYLIPDDLDGIEYCFSPGVGARSEFENHLADRGIKSFLADYSIETPPSLRPELTFDRKHLGSRNNEELFTLAAWKKMYLQDYSGDLLLQMDIEGAEYEVILNAPEDLLSQFRILVIEFHHLHRLFDPFCFALISSCFEKLLASFHVVHIHPNNQGAVVGRGEIEVPEILEFTFLNRKRAGAVEPQRVIPNELDARNVPGLQDLPLPACWYSST